MLFKDKRAIYAKEKDPFNCLFNSANLTETDTQIKQGTYVDRSEKWTRKDVLFLWSFAVVISNIKSSAPFLVPLEPIEELYFLISTPNSIHNLHSLTWPLRSAK